VDFLRYAEASAHLVNSPLADAADLRELVGARERLRELCTDRDALMLRRFQGRLRRVFEASAAGDVRRVTALLNELLLAHPITPQISDHEPDGLHIHVAPGAASVAELLVSESLLGLANLVCDLGPTRLGVCHASPCTNVYLDTSPNRSRRYCSDRCSSRANVAAYRARQKAAIG
jgi:predicted RNA-binding Zn ribbon-like protein